MIASGEIALAIGFARTAAFTAAMPLGGARIIPRIVRVVLALGLAPIAATARPLDQHAPHDWSVVAAAVVWAAVQGAAVGLCATIVAGAATAAGSLIDAALASQPAPLRDVFGESGPMCAICTSAFGWFFFGAAFERLAGVCIAAEFKTVGVPAIASLAIACAQTALSAAGPAIVAQAFATVTAAAIARMAPRVNGMFLGAPIAAVIILAMLAAGGGALLWSVGAMTWRAAGAAGALR